jgi:hypothetical protein
MHLRNTLAWIAGKEPVLRRMLKRSHVPTFRRFLFALLLLALTGCVPALPAPFLAPTPNLPRMAPFVIAKADPGIDPSATPFQPEPVDTSMPAAEFHSPVPPTAAPVTPTNTPSATQTPNIVSPTAAQPTPPPDSSDRTHYTLYVTLDYAGRNVAANETIRYVNSTGQALSEIVLAVEPNLWGDCFTLASLSEDGAEATNYDLTGHRLTVYPAQPLAPGAVTSIAMGYSLSLPVKAYDGTFGYTSSQVNLTDWYPFIVPYVGGWVLHDHWGFGEYLVYDASDFDVYIKTDNGVILAASAPAEASGDTTHYHLEAARTFAFSASDSFRVDESAVGSVKIYSYYFAGDGNASQAVVWMATQSLGLYGAKFGDYPYQSLSIVETGLPDGQEFSGMVFLGSSFYSGYNGSARSNLVMIGTHEIAHQWWYGMVGDDQASEPWLDEALSVYSERIFYEYNYPGYGDWWWNFRVNYFHPAGYVDSSVYAFGNFHDYVSAVYLNGANFLEDLRSRIGDDAFFAFLKDYAARESGRIATSADFFSVLRENTDAKFSDIVRSYMRGSY